MTSEMKRSTPALSCYNLVQNPCRIDPTRNTVGQSPDLNSGSRWHRWEPHVHAPGTVLNDQFKGADSWERYLSPRDRDAGYALQFLALHRDIGRLSRLRTESLASHTDIENWRPETRARNWSDVAQNRENCASEIPQRLANSRECRGYF